MTRIAQPEFQFCPACAASGLSPEEEHAVRCGACGFLFFFNSAAAVAALIEDDAGRILLTRRAREPARGLWDLPGGFVNPGETAEDAVAREIKEELNLDVLEAVYRTSTPGTYDYAGVTYPITNLVFTCRVGCFENMRPDDDVAQIMFIGSGDMDLDQIGLASMRTVLRWWMKRHCRAPGE